MYLDKAITFRLRIEEYDEIKEILYNSKDIYESESHFIRCAILRLVRDERRRLQYGDHKDKTIER